MWTGVSGMTAAQSGLNATAHNMANINTKGYTRQQLLQVDTHYATVSYGKNGTAQKVGLGTYASSIRQLRNRYYDQTYRTELGRQGFYESQYNATLEIEDLFGETQGVAFQKSIDGIWTALEELSKEPESIVTRATFVTKCNEFITRSEDIMNQLKKYQIDMNTEIEDTVGKINDLGNTIYELNKKIISAEVGNIERANDLRDQRNNALDELAKYIDISYQEGDKGCVTVYAEGSAFVSELSVNKMAVREIENSTMYEPYWISTGDAVINTSKITKIDSDSDIGYLKGLMIARGQSTANYADIPIKPEEPAYPAKTDYMITDATGNKVLDTDAYDAALTKYGEDYNVYKLDLNKYNVELDKYNLTVDTSVMMTSMAQFDQLIHGIVTSINDILSPNKTISVMAPDGTISQMKVLDEENAPVGMDDESTMGEALFNRKGVERYITVEVDVVNTDEDGNIVYNADGTVSTTKKTVRKYNEENKSSNYSLFTLGEIEINDKILKDYSKLPLSENANGGDFSYTGVVQDLIDMWGKDFTTLSPNTLTKYNFKDYYTALNGDIGNRGDTFKTMTESQQTTVDQIEYSRQNYAGVAQDEELSNLIKYQYSYNAASRYFNVVNGMLENILALFT